MNHRRRHAPDSDRSVGTGPGFVGRLVGGTVVAAGILGSLAVATGPVGIDGVAPAAADVDRVAVTVPAQPPIPPGPPVPPPMQEPGQQNPDSSIHGDPPPGPSVGEPGSCADFVVVGGYPMLNPNRVCDQA